jgi:hypothetical protein
VDWAVCGLWEDGVVARYGMQDAVVAGPWDSLLDRFRVCVVCSGVVVGGVGAGFWSLVGSGVVGRVDRGWGSGKLEGLPRMGPGVVPGGVCPFLENSTAC